MFGPQVEAAHLPWAGQPVELSLGNRSESSFRLLHVASGQYLAAEADEETGGATVELTDEYMMKNCLWEFVPIDKSDAAQVHPCIHSSFYAFIILSIHPSMHSSIYASIYLSIHPSF